MLRRFSSFGTGCLLLEGSVSIYEAVSNVKETYTSDGKIPGKGDLFRNPF
jgi:gamma-glutamyltranspeptidase/glutathione hydrolase